MSRDSSKTVKGDAVRSETGPDSDVSGVVAPQAESTAADLVVELAEARAALRKMEQLRAAADSEHNALTNLFVITRGLHESLDRAQVSDVVRDIIINFVGCEELAFYEASLSEPGAPLVFERRWVFGAEDIAPAQVVPGDPLFERLSQSGYFVLGKDAMPLRSATDPSAVIPLRVDESHIGAVVLFGLLPQRTHFELLDEEIFAILSRHAAHALYAATLHQRFGAGLTGTDP